MSNTVPIRTLLTMSEVQEQLRWSEHALLDALMNGRLVPSYYASHEAEVFVSDGAGYARRMQDGVFKDGLVYAVRFRRFDAWDGNFEHVADEPVEAKGSVLYRLWRGEPKLLRFLPLRDVLAEGGVTQVELERFLRNSMGAASPSIAERSSDKANQWWSQEYDICEMAAEIKTEKKTANFGNFLDGPRAGDPSLRDVAKAIAYKISSDQLAAGSARTIGSRTIENFLRGRGIV